MAKKVEKKSFKTTLPTELITDLQLIQAGSGKTMSDFLTEELQKVVSREAKAMSKRLSGVAAK